MPGSLTNFEVFQEELYTVSQGMLAYNIDLFNAASRGAIILQGGAHQGDFDSKALYARIPNLVRRRDAYGVGALTATDISMLLDTSVKVAAGTNPVNIDAGLWQWIQRDPAEAAVLIAKQLAEEQMADMVGVAIRAFVAATTNVGSTVVYDGTGATLGLRVLNRGAALFGDRAQAIGCWIMHSTPFTDLIDASIQNTAQLFVFGTVQIRTDTLGRPLIVTDQPDLIYTVEGATRYHTLGLVPGAVIIDQNNDYKDNVETSNGQNNLLTTWQAQWTYNVGLKGYAWDTATGGKSPTDAALATGTNWDKFAESIKDTAGVLVNSQ